ncbi:MAG TPA: hypothetical protein VGG74_31555 [Kofleriaceae bacterium]
MKLVVACGLLCACQDQHTVIVGQGAAGSAESAGSAAAAVVGAPRWAVALGTAYSDTGTGVAIDSTGDVVAVGVFDGPLDSQGIAIPTGFITKRAASDGSERWTAQIVTTADRSYLSVMGVAVDPTDDSIVITGDYQNSIDFGGQTVVEPTGDGAAFVAKYSAGGQLQWVITPETGATGLAVTIDSAAQITVAGTIDVNAGSDDGPDTFVTAYDSAGNQQWSHTLDNASVQAITLAANDDVVLAGDISMPASVGGAVLTPAAGASAYVTRFRNDGSYVASRVVGTQQEQATQVLATTSGQIVVQTVVDSGSNYSSSELYALDDNNDDLWSVQLADDGNYGPLIRTLAAAPSGDIVSSAWNDKGGSGAMQVVAFDEAGSSSTSEFGNRVASAPAATAANASTISATGATAYVGNFVGTVELAGSPLTSQNQTGIGAPTDVFVVLLAPPM